MVPKLLRTLSNNKERTSTLSAARYFGAGEVDSGLGLLNVTLGRGIWSGVHIVPGRFQRSCHGHCPRCYWGPLSLSNASLTVRAFIMNRQMLFQVRENSYMGCPFKALGPRHASKIEYSEFQRHCAQLGLALWCQHVADGHCMKRCMHSIRLLSTDLDY